MDNILESLQRKIMGWESYSESRGGSMEGNSDGVYPDSIPEAYIQWRRQVFRKIPGALTIHLGPRKSLSLRSDEDRSDNGIDDDDGSGSGTSVSSEISEPEVVLVLVLVEFTYFFVLYQHVN